MTTKSRAIISLVAVGVISIVAVVLFMNSSNLENPLLPSSKPQASLSQIKQTEFYVDPFKTSEIDADKWRVNEVGGAKVSQTETNNLRMEIPSNTASGTASLVFKQLLKKNGDFRVRAVIFKPTVTGNGRAISGVRFNSTGNTNDETAVAQWVVSKTGTTGSSKISFVVRGAGGNALESESVDFSGDVAVLRLERVNKEYRAFYKPGSDLSGDKSWVALGVKKSSGLGSDGNVLLFTRNDGPSGAYPTVVGRFDQVNIGWEGITGLPVTRTTFSDSFNNNAVATSWKVSKTNGSNAAERPSDNLVLSVAATAEVTKPGIVNVKRTDPVVKIGKDFIFQTVVYKPVLTGEGFGNAGLSFASTTTTDDEAARVYWSVGGGQSRVIFSVRNPDGTITEKSSVTLEADEKNITLRLMRTGDKYSGWFRTGDLDTDFVRVGNDASVSFGAGGHMNLFANNAGGKVSLPKVVAKFDQAFGSFDK